jgi:hypothetical protein
MLRLKVDGLGGDLERAAFGVERRLVAVRLG